MDGSWRGSGRLRGVGSGSVREAMEFSSTLPPPRVRKRPARRPEIEIGAQHLRVIRKALAAKRTGLQIAEYERMERAMTWKRLISKRIVGVLARHDIYDSGWLRKDVIRRALRALPRELQVGIDQVDEVLAGLPMRETDGAVEYTRVPSRMFLRDMIDVDAIAEAGIVTEAEVRAYLEEEEKSRKGLGEVNTDSLFRVPPSDRGKRPISQSIFKRDMTALTRPRRVVKDVYGMEVKKEFEDFAPGEGAFAGADRMGSRQGRRMKVMIPATGPRPATWDDEAHAPLTPSEPYRLVHPAWKQEETAHLSRGESRRSGLLTLVDGRRRPQSPTTTSSTSSSPHHHTTLKSTDLHSLVPIGTKAVKRKAFFWGASGAGKKHEILHAPTLPPMPGEASQVERAAHALDARPPTPPDPVREAQLTHEFHMATESLHLWRRAVRDQTAKAATELAPLPRRTRREHLVALTLGSRKVAAITSRFETSNVLAAFLKWRDFTILDIHAERARNYIRAKAIRKLDRVAHAAALRFKAFAFFRLRALTHLARRTLTAEPQRPVSRSSIHRSPPSSPIKRRPLSREVHRLAPGAKSFTDEAVSLERPNRAGRRAKAPPMLRRVGSSPFN